MESQIEQILSDGHGYTAKEIAHRLWSDENPSGWDVGRDFMLWVRLEQMVREHRIVSRVIDGKAYFAKR